MRGIRIPAVSDSCSSRRGRGVPIHPPTERVAQDRPLPSAFGGVLGRAGHRVIRTCVPISQDHYRCSDSAFLRHRRHPVPRSIRPARTSGGWSTYRKRSWDNWCDDKPAQAATSAGSRDIKDPSCDTRSMDAEFESIDPPPLHDAARFGQLARARQLIREGSDADAMWWGRTPLWEAVMDGSTEVALALVAAGADPWRKMIAGWSPGRLNLAGSTPDLFGNPPDGVALSPEEQAAVAECRRLIGALGSIDPDGSSYACIAGVDAAEATRRLGAEPLHSVDTDQLMEDPWETGLDDDELEAIVGISDVPGGCVIGQWWGYTPSTPGVMAKLTPDTVGYGMYGNPKSGNQGRSFRDGLVVDWDTHPGGGQAVPDNTSDETLRIFLYRHHPIPYCCNFVDLRPIDGHGFTGPPDRWLRLPPIDLWPEN
jgi:hypothetical protein